jgi:NitT/TauT family transport system ATP-binding protein
VTADFQISAGFMPLLDSMLLVAAQEKGFAAAESIELRLVRETSWANIRDRLAVGQFEVAHMLAPMALAAALGLTPIPSPTIAPMALGLGGNGITVSTDLWERLLAAGAPSGLEAAGTGAALKQVAAGGRLRFGVVHPYSAHNYELRYWLSACGVHPEADVEIVVLPPPLLPDALASGAIDGYCVGEPWNSVAVAAGAGRIATVKSAIWRSSPEKVLGVRRDWAEQHPQALAALLRSLYRAALWCGAPENAAEAAAMLGQKHYLDLPPALIEHGLTGQLALGDGRVEPVEDFFLPQARAATYPSTSHALWFYSQMVRWGQVGHAEERARQVEACYRPDLYRAALAPLRVPVPAAMAKIDGFFDGQAFDPARLQDYLDAQRRADAAIAHFG